MTSGIVNLNKARKARAKLAAAAAAKANRAKHGRTGAERETDALAVERSSKQLDQHRIEGAGEDD